MLKNKDGSPVTIPYYIDIMVRFRGGCCENSILQLRDKKAVARMDGNYYMYMFKCTECGVWESYRELVNKLTEVDVYFE